MILSTGALLSPDHPPIFTPKSQAASDEELIVSHAATTTECLHSVIMTLTELQSLQVSSIRQVGLSPL